MNQSAQTPDFPALSDTDRMARLARPTGRVRMVLDTDTYNEIDDQFALVHALLSPDQVTAEAIYAAPFHNARSSGPDAGMEKSHAEILRVFDRLGLPVEGRVFRGSRAFLADPAEPVDSDAARDLVARARGCDADDPLYVVAIGAITNVASALLMAPDIVRHIVVVWLGGHALHWPHTREFNLYQDIPSARTVFDSGVPLVHVPCQGVVSHLHTSIPEMDALVNGRGPIGDYLFEIFRAYGPADRPWSKVLWDLAATAWTIIPSAVPADLVHSPIVTDQGTWSVDTARHLIRYVHGVNRDAIFADLCSKLPPRTPH